MEVTLPETIEECHSLIRNLLSIIEKMQTEIDELQARLNENSNNSNRPPSSDLFSKRKSAMPKNHGKRGGLRGHLGKTLQQVAEPDVIIDCAPQPCQCGASTFVSEAEITDSGQVFDLPSNSQYEKNEISV